MKKGLFCTIAKYTDIFYHRALQLISREICDVDVDPVFKDGKLFCCSVRTAKHQS